MIVQLTGTLVELTASHVVLDVGGVGSVSYTHLTLPTNREV